MTLLFWRSLLFFIRFYEALNEGSSRLDSFRNAQTAVRITCGLVQAQINKLLTVPVGQHDLVETVSNRIRMAPDTGPSQKDLAGSVNVSDRTLRRRLSQQGTTYRALRNSARFDKARDLLANSSLTIAEVASEVGNSDTRAFRRAFKRWSGQLPSAFRVDRE